MRWLSSFVVCVLLFAAGLEHGNVPAAEIPTITLQMGYLAGDVMQLGEPYRHFAERVDQLSGGRVKIVLHPGASVCADVACIKDVIQDSLDIGSSSDANFDAITPLMSVISMPFLFRSQSAQDEVMDKGLALELSRELESKVNLVPLMWLSQGGGRNLFYNNGSVVRTPRDFKGMKIRSTASRSEIATDKAWGGEPVVGDPTSVYAGLQQGVYKANYVQNHWIAGTKRYEVVKFATLIHASYSYQLVVMRADKFHQLPESVQSILESAGAETTKWDRSRAIAADRAALQVIEAHGVKVYEPTEREMKRWVAVAPQVWAQFRDQVPSSLIQRILKQQGCPATGCVPSL